MSYKLNTLKQLSRVIFDSILPNPTFGDIDITDDEVKLTANGIIKFITINFNGRVYIYNKLPDGYGMSITRNKLFIYNLLGKKLNNDGLLFKFIGNLDIRKAEVRTFSGNKFVCGIKDINKLQFINYSETNVEDDTLLFLEAQIDSIGFVPKNQIDDNSIKGLYTEKSFADGYFGYYNYHPDEGVYMTGKQLTNESKPILNPKLPTKSKTIQKKIKKLSTKYNRLLKERNLEKTQVSKRVEKAKPIDKKEDPKKPKISGSRILYGAKK